MAKTLQLPDGRRVNFNNVTDWVLSGSTISFIRADGTGFSYSATGGVPFYAEYVLRQIDQAFLSDLNFMSLTETPLIITAIAPTSFDILTANLTITGKGFSAAGAGKLYIEDAAGGLDWNGYYLNCTVVNDNKMTAVYGGPGDAGLASPVSIAYRAADGTVSNIIAASNPSGTNITIP